MSTLYSLDTELRALEQQLEDAQSEGFAPTANEQLAQVFAAYLETEDRLVDKIDRVAAMIREIEARASERASESKRLSTLANSDLGQANTLRRMLHTWLESRNLERIETRRFRILLQTNGGLVPLEAPADLALIPERFVRMQPLLDRDALRHALEAGEDVPGCRLGERGKRMVIK